MNVTCRCRLTPMAFPGDMQFPQYQVVLLGPQVKYMLKTLSDKAASLNIPVQPIDTMDYGMQRGDNVLNYALSLIPAAH